MKTIKLRHTGLLEKPKTVTDALNDIVKQMNGNTTETQTRIKALEENPVIYLGEDLPSNNFGKDGDLFLVKSTKTFYYKQAGTWN